MKNTSNVPRLRFPKFTGTWEQREFDKVFLSFPNKNYQLQSTEYYESGKFPIIDQGKKAIIGYSDNESKVCNKYPSIIFGDHTTELKYVDFPFIIGADGVKTLSVKDGDTLFQYYNLQVNKVQPTGYNRHFSMLKEISLCVPCLAEQRQIGTYFRNLDTLITLHQRKCEKLEEYKKAMLQKIFSQELRFKREGGTDYPEWEQTSLEDVCDIVGGGTPSTKNIDYWNGNIQWFTPSEIGKTKYVSKSVRTISQVGFEKSSARKLPVGTILLTSRATLGEMAIATIECTTNQGFQSLIPRRINGEYLYYLQPTIKNYCNKKACGSTFNEISKGELGKCKIPMPHFEEQQKIAGFLSALDEAISYAKQELDKWKELKKGLLQQMFV